MHGIKEVTRTYTNTSIQQDHQISFPNEVSTCTEGKKVASTRTHYATTKKKLRVVGWVCSVEAGGHQYEYKYDYALLRCPATCYML